MEFHNTEWRKVFYNTAVTGTGCFPLKEFKPSPTEVSLNFPTACTGNFFKNFPGERTLSGSERLHTILLLSHS